MAPPRAPLGGKPFMGVNPQHTQRKGDSMTHEVSVFTRILKAASQGKPVQLSFADVELLAGVLGDELGRAETECRQWRERLRGYEISSKRDYGGSKETS